MGVRSHDRTSLPGGAAADGNNLWSVSVGETVSHGQHDTTDTEGRVGRSKVEVNTDSSENILAQHSV